MQKKAFDIVEFAPNEVAPRSKMSIGQGERAFYDKLMGAAVITDVHSDALLPEAFQLACSTGERLRKETHPSGTPEFLLADAVRLLLTTRAAKDGYTVAFYRHTVLMAFFAKLLSDHHDETELGNRLTRMLQRYMPQ